MIFGPKRLLSGNTIRMRLLRMQITLALIILFLGSVVFTTDQIISYRKSMNSSLESLTEIIATNVRFTLAFQDQNEANRILKSLEVDENVRGAVVYDSNDSIFAEYRNHDQERDWWQTDLLETITLEKTIRDRGDYLGKIRITIGLERLRDGYVRSIYLFLLTMAIGAALALVIGNYAQAFLSKPIVSLAEAVKTISRSNNYSVRVPEFKAHQTADEFETLAREFNQMLELIQIRDREILAGIEHAETANRLKSAFLANISHELRTPMHGILSFARFGMDRTKSPELEHLNEFFKEIDDSGTRLMVLLNDLLDLSKMEAGKMNYNIETIALEEVAEQMSSEMRGYLPEKNIRIECHPNVLGAFVECDSLRIRQVLNNLLSNAIKFSTQNSVVAVNIDLENDGVTCTVTNTGIGIPKQELASIFDKFSQSSRTANGAGGTGLGLSICREIINHHRGRIWAESDADGTTRFKFTLPRAEELHRAS